VNDLTALFDTLRSFKDIDGNSPVITANSVTANPDFGKIKEGKFKEYYYESVLNTFRRKQGSEHTFLLIKEGMEKGLYRPQFHGREHLNVQQWINGLQFGDEVLKKAFDVGVFGIDLKSKYTKRANFMAAFDDVSDNVRADHNKIIEEGTKQFKDLYGFRSSSFVAPSYVWHPTLEPILMSNGINFLQGIPIQFSPNNSSNFRKIYHYQGQRNSFGQRYFIRNCFFEPSLNPGFNWIEDILKRLKIIFYWNKPAIIGTHRINFIGSLREENRSKNLILFSKLLQEILKIWPNVRFTSTDNLGNLYSKMM
jgi:hypothetical protein